MSMETAHAEPSNAEAIRVKRPAWRWALRIVGWIILALVCFALTIWSALAVCLTDLSGGASPRYVAAALTAIILIACLIFVRPAKFRLIAFALGFLVIVLWFL